MPIDLDALRVEVVPQERIDPVNDLVSDLGAGMSARLVSRTEEGPTAVPGSTVDVPAPSLLGIAVRLTIERELTGIDVRPHTVREQRFLVGAVDGSPYVSSLLISPGPPFGLEGVTDLLVCAPRLSLVVCRPLERDFTAPVVTLDRLTTSLHGQAADPCSPHIFWWRDGTLHRITVDHDARDIALPPPVAGLVGTLPRQI